MFDSLLGRKFTVKCKQAIKCINERLRLIRKRKQAMLNFLKQDIAELLRNGHDSHAFNRMDALIVEINHLACYDMIEKFCECILKQLPLLQKQRECPLEDMEAASTLIFAAARFSDLPELCDLRYLFMARYGGAMETSVNPEFKEKLASRSFSMATKVQLMQNIAQEFSVTWDSEAFEYRTTYPMANECVKEKDGKKSDGVYEPSINIVKDVVAETKDIRVIGHEPEATRKSKICDYELENVNPYPPDTLTPHYVQPKENKGNNFMEDWQKKDGTYRSPRAQEVLDPIGQEGKVFEEIPKDDCRAGSKVPQLFNGEQDGADAEHWHDDQSIHNRSSRVRGKLEYGADADDWHKNGTHFKRSSKARMHRKGEQRQTVVGYEFEDNDKSTKVHHAKPEGIEDATDSEDDIKLAAGEHKSEDSKKPIKAPPYVKPKAMKDAVHSDDWEDDGIVNRRSAKAGTDLAAQEGQIRPRKSNQDRAYHMIPPPYVKPKVSTLTDDARSSSPPINEGGLAASDKSSTWGYRNPQKDEIGVDYERAKPRSVRRTNKKSPAVPESDNAADGNEPIPRIQHGQRRHATRKKTSAPQDDYDSEDEVIDRLLIHYSKKKVPHQPRKHRERTQSHVEDHVMDGYGIEQQHQTYDRCHINRPGSPQALCAEHVDDGKAGHLQTDGKLHNNYMPESIQAPSEHHRPCLRQHTDKPESVHLPERAVSLPPDPSSIQEKIKGPARATSMQPDSVSPPGEHRHPRLPSYEELSARFAALKRG